MNYQLTTEPSAEPVTLDEAKSHLRLEESVDDDLVSACITAARQHIEGVCWRGLLKQTYELKLYGFLGEDLFGNGPDWMAAPRNRRPYIDLPRGHLNKETPDIVVQYLDENGAAQTLDASEYLVDMNVQRCGRLHPKTEWPSTTHQFNAVTITYKVGWTTADEVPKPLKQAILLLVSQMYEYRTPQITGTIATEMEFTINALTQQYRLKGL